MNGSQRNVAFMKSALALWVKTLQEDEKCIQKEVKDYIQLCNGLFLNKVWLQIDPHSEFQNVNFGVEETGNRIRNLNYLLNNIKTFYENVLGQLLVLKLPDVIKIATSSDDSTSYEEMRVLLLLLLGCAVQCEQKEHFIDRIKQLDVSVQHAIVDCIQQITDNPESVWLNNEWSVLPDDEHERHRLYSLLVQHINRLVKERDEFYQRVVELSLEFDHICPIVSQIDNSLSESDNSSSLCISSPNIWSNLGEQKSHVIAEVADVKSKLRRLQQELEEKNEIVSELKEILEQNKESCNKLRQDNLELIQEARSAKAYRDENDILNERVRKVDLLETEIQRYRDKLNELEFYKSRVEELREDNRILTETKVMLEEQLDVARKRADQVPDLEAQILKLKAYSSEFSIQRDLDRSQIERFLEEISHLRLDKKVTADELTAVQSELSNLRCQIKTDLLHNNEKGNLLEQINNDTSKRILKLELENQRLQSLVENLKNNTCKSLTTSASHLNNNEQYDSRMGIIDNFSNGNDSDGLQSPGDMSITSDSPSVSELNAKLEKAENENECLRQTLVGVKRAELKVIELESVRNDLQNELKDLNSKRSADLIKYEQIERNTSQLLTENQRLQRMIESKVKRIEEAKHEIQAFESENQKLLATVETLKSSVKRLNDLEREVTNVEALNHRLEQEKKSLEKEIVVLKQAIVSKDSTIDEYATKISTIELENKQIRKNSENNCQAIIKLKELEKLNELPLNNKVYEENSKLKQENNVLTEEHKRLQTEYKMLQNIYKKLRNENNELKQKHTELQGETAECRDKMSVLDVEVSKLSNYCEVVAFTNNSLESHRKSLISNMSNLLSQYHELLNEIASDSEKLIIDKMHELCAKKEKMEKMIKEFDVTVEKKKVTVNTSNVVRKIQSSSTDLCLSKTQIDNHFSPANHNLIDEAIYGRIWEAETPPLSVSNIVPVIRPLTANLPSVNDLQLVEKNNDIKTNLFAQDETIKRDAFATPVDASVPPPRPPPRVSTTIENKMTISVVTSHPTSSSPLNNSAVSVAANNANRNNANNTKSNTYLHNNFTRGTYKSNSINYGSHGSPVRRDRDQSLSQSLSQSHSRSYQNGHHIHAHHAHHSHSASPSLHSDSSLTPVEDSELSDSTANASNRSRNLNNVDNVTVNSNATNSIWYEYGCV